MAIARSQVTDESFRVDLRCVATSNTSTDGSYPALTVGPCSHMSSWRLKPVPLTSSASSRGRSEDMLHVLVSADGTQCAAVPHLPTSHLPPGTFPPVNTPGYVLAVPCRGALDSSSGDSTVALWLVRGSTLQLYDRVQRGARNTTPKGNSNADDMRVPLCLTATAPNNRVTVAVALRLRYPNGSAVVLTDVREENAANESLFATTSARFTAQRGACDVSQPTLSCAEFCLSQQFRNFHLSLHVLAVLCGCANVFAGDL